jgi:hypothetical protein
MSDLNKEALEAWHFVGATLRDGRPIPPDNQWLVHDGPVVPCKSGLHASARLIDALQYAPGNTLCRVLVRGDIQHHGNDKLVGRERLILWRVDAEPVLAPFARRCALDVAHLWDMPDVVRRYLETGDETLRVAARGAALAAARAAWGAAGAAARDAWEAALAAAGGAWEAALAAAGGAALAAAGAAALAAAGAAARDAARAAAWFGACDAAWDCARDAQNDTLTRMVMEARND